MKWLYETYLAVRYREWIVYDPLDCVVVYVGSRKNCIQVQEQMYGGLVVVPLKDPLI